MIHVLGAGLAGRSSGSFGHPDGASFPEHKRGWDGPLPNSNEHLAVPLRTGQTTSTGVPVVFGKLARASRSPSRGWCERFVLARDSQTETAVQEQRDAMVFGMGMCAGTNAHARHLGP